MTPKQFVQKWSQILVNEIAMAQSHFIDVCALIGHATPLEVDPKGEFFTFEAAVQKSGGNQGRADVWYKGKFIWEYKGAHADLDKAYQQLLLYRESLGNPPLLITSDTKRIIIHTNFTNTVKKIYEVDFDSILSGQGVDFLRRAFTNPESFRPDETQEAVTRASADAFVRVARTLQGWAKAEGRQEDPERLAHFLIRLLFALFAEDMKLLPESVFSKLVETHKGNPNHFRLALSGLFAAMRDGKMFGFYPIRYFDGGLFDDEYVPDLPGGILHDLAEACVQNWAGLEPSIFGTLFERIIDESKRAQLGAHYTSKDDIMLIVEPVLMQPLREEWQTIKHEVGSKLKSSPPDVSNVQFHPSLTRLQDFAAKIASIRVLDPACGSGNFLYVALRQLLDLQKEVIVFAAQVRGTWESKWGEMSEEVRRTFEIPLMVSPHQLFGIEINPYAHELAQITVWIGYLQWRLENGFAEFPDPVLRPLKNIENKDAILAYNESGEPVEPEWPEVEVVIGNPPFLGGKRMRTELGDEYVDKVFAVWDEKVPREADIVCYWFEKARAQIERKGLIRAGLLATQGIRGGANRKVLDKIKQTGDIFWAYSDRNWYLDGAMVHVSMLGFDDGNNTHKVLDEKYVNVINSDLTSSIDVTQAKRLAENQNLSFMGVTPAGPFDIPGELARRWFDLERTFGSPRPYKNVVRPYYNGNDLTKRPRDIWIIDFGVDMPFEEASLYEDPFLYVQEHVKPEREKSRVPESTPWWIFTRTRPALRTAIEGIQRYIGTSMVSKHFFFNWVSTEIVPANLMIVIAREDDYLFGILHSSVHELWARRQGTQLREAESGTRYTPTTCFETFPFPWPPGQEPSQQERRSSGETFSAGHASDERRSLSDPQAVESERHSLSDDLQKEEAIAEAARQLDSFRNAWLFPPEKEIGVMISESMLKKRTLTNLYNALTDYREKVKGKHRDVNVWYRMVDGIIGLDEIETLDHIHNQLDRAVLAAYGWPAHLSDEEILGRLLEENLRRGAQPR